MDVVCMSIIYFSFFFRLVEKFIQSEKNAKIIIISFRIGQHRIKRETFSKYNEKEGENGKEKQKAMVPNLNKIKTQRNKSQILPSINPLPQNPHYLEINNQPIYFSIGFINNQ